MRRTIILKFLFIPIGVLAAGFLGFVYSKYALYAMHLQNPFAASPELPTDLFGNFYLLIKDALAGNLGPMPRGFDYPVADALKKAIGASLGLLGVVVLGSTLVGLTLGLSAVNHRDGTIRRWLAPITAVGMALPSYIMGILFVLAIIFITIRQKQGGTFFLPVGGFGWDEHIVLPALALMIRPTAQLAHLSAHVLSDELRKQYITAARAFGHSWLRIRWKDAMRNILSPVIMTVAGSARFLLGEMILVEYIFDWPGLGYLFGWTLMPPRIAMLQGFYVDVSSFFLHTPLLTMLITLLTFIFLVLDFSAIVAVECVDPRVRHENGGGENEI